MRSRIVGERNEIKTEAGNGRGTKEGREGKKKSESRLRITEKRIVKSTSEFNKGRTSKNSKENGEKKSCHHQTSPSPVRHHLSEHQRRESKGDSIFENKMVSQNDRGGEEYVLFLECSKSTRHE